MFICAGAASVLVIRQAEARAVDAEIAEEVEDLGGVFTRGGLAALTSTIEARQRDPSRWEYRVEDARKDRLAGDLPAVAFPNGWSTQRLVEGDKPNGESEVVRTQTRELAAGLRLTVGQELAERWRADRTVMGSIAAASILIALTGLGLGTLFGRRVLGHLDLMATVVNRYAGGDLAARIPGSRQAPPDLHRFATALNHMLDSNSALVESIRQISSDIAHDLRRPLAHHNQGIAQVLEAPRSAEAYRSALETASSQVSEVLATFQALLQISELEAGAPGLELEPVDLAELAARVVDAYAPMAAEGGRSLAFTPPADPAVILGEPRLLGRLLANLVENALIHTPPGAQVTVSVDAAGPTLSVADNGPGVPAHMRERIFQRFVRLEESRSSPGTGLGLALSSAIAKACRARLSAHDEDPGLRVVVSFSPE